jgi:hypothetical protein
LGFISPLVRLFSLFIRPDGYGYQETAIFWLSLVNFVCNPLLKPTAMISKSDFYNPSFIAVSFIGRIEK